MRLWELVVVLDAAAGVAAVVVLVDDVHIVVVAAVENVCLSDLVVVLSLIHLQSSFMRFNVFKGKY